MTEQVVELTLTWLNLYAEKIVAGHCALSLLWQPLQWNDVECDLAVDELTVRNASQLASEFSLTME